MSQSWADNSRVVFSSVDPAGHETIRVINVDTGRVEHGPFVDFHPGHEARNGKVLMSRRGGARPAGSAAPGPGAGETTATGLHELDIATGKLRLVLAHAGSIHHVQYSPDGRKALFNANDNYNVSIVNLDGTGFRVLDGPDRRKPMHVQWYDNHSFFGGIHEKRTLGVDLDKHHLHETYRWNLDGEITDFLAGICCHGATRADHRYFAGESWYGSDPVALWIYARGRRQPLATIYSHRFPRIVWNNGGRHHVNPAFSRDGMRLYYKKTVARDTSQAFVCDLTGLVEPMH